MPSPWSKSQVNCHQHPSQLVDITGPESILSLSLSFSLFLSLSLQVDVTASFDSVSGDETKEGVTSKVTSATVDEIVPVRPPAFPNSEKKDVNERERGKQGGRERE